MCIRVGVQGCQRLSRGRAGPSYNLASLVRLYRTTQFPITYLHNATFLELFRYFRRGTSTQQVIGGMMLPTFHSMGLALQIFIPLFTKATLAMFAPAFPLLPPIPSPPAMLKAMKSTKTTICLVVPVFIEAWASSNDTVEFLKTLDLLVIRLPFI